MKLRLTLLRTVDVVVEVEDDAAIDLLDSAALNTLFSLGQPEDAKEMDCEEIMGRAGGEEPAAAWVDCRGVLTVDGSRRGISRRGALPLISTDVRALRAMRYEEEMRGAVALHRIDLAIEKAGRQ